jgi:hypothetical protein
MPFINLAASPSRPGIRISRRRSKRRASARGGSIKKPKLPFVALDGNNPIDLCTMLCMCTVEFFQTHMDPKHAQEKHANFLASCEDVLFSEEGRRTLHAGWEKYLKMVEDASSGN